MPTLAPRGLDQSSTKHISRRKRRRPAARSYGPAAHCRRRVNPSSQHGKNPRACLTPTPSSPTFVPVSPCRKPPKLVLSNAPAQESSAPPAPSSPCSFRTSSPSSRSESGSSHSAVCNHVSVANGSTQWIDRLPRTRLKGQQWHGDDTPLPKTLCVTSHQHYFVRTQGKGTVVFQPTSLQWRLLTAAGKVRRAPWLEIASTTTNAATTGSKAKNISSLSPHWRTPCLVVEWENILGHPTLRPQHSCA